MPKGRKDLPRAGKIPGRVSGACPARPGDAGQRGRLLGQGVERCSWKFVRGSAGASKRDGGTINPRKHRCSSLIVQINLIFKIFMLGASLQVNPMGAVLFTVAVGIKAYLGKDERDLFRIISPECELESHRRTPHSHENHGQRIKLNLRNTCETVKQTTAQKKIF